MTMTIVDEFIKKILNNIWIKKHILFNVQNIKN